MNLHFIMKVSSKVTSCIYHGVPFMSLNDLHPFQVSLPTSPILSHRPSFIPRTCNLWNVLSSSCFPESYNLPSFNSKINKLDLISLLLAFRFLLSSFVWALYRPLAFPQHNSLKKEELRYAPSCCWIPFPDCNHSLELIKSCALLYC